MHDAGSVEQGADWLVRMYLECGLEEEQAKEAATVTQIRLLKRQNSEKSPVRRLGSFALTQSLVRDPLVSFNRIVGLGTIDLPFYDGERGMLSLVAFASVLDEIGLEADVALAFAKVVVEAFDPEEFYLPIWNALGRTDPINLEELRRLDWTPLRENLPDEPKRKA